MDSKNFAIGVLSTTAVILLVGLLVINTRPEPAAAFGMNAQGGDYLLVTGQLQQNEEMLYVVDAASQKMIVYRFDLNRKQISVSHAVDLGKMAGPQKEKKSTKDSPRRGRGRRR